MQSSKNVEIAVREFSSQLLIIYLIKCHAEMMKSR